MQHQYVNVCLCVHTYACVSEVGEEGKGQEEVLTMWQACENGIWDSSSPEFCSPNLTLVVFAENTKVRYLRKLNYFRS